MIDHSTGVSWRLSRSSNLVSLGKVVCSKTATKDADKELSTGSNKVVRVIWVSLAY